MCIQDCFYYNELSDYSFSNDYFEMIEYTLKAYNEKKINEDLTINDISLLKMELIDLDAIRWFKGEITTKELFEQYKSFFLRR